MDADLMSFNELSGSIGARCISHSSASGFSSVSIDSRKTGEGSLYFALTGKTNDGHEFVEDAFKAGAAAAVVDVSKLDVFNLAEIAKKNKKDLIVVDDTLKGLQDSARVYLEKFPALLKIGITGSCGKTTTKEIASAIISNEKNTVMNKGNLNSETGLPLSVFEVRSNHEVCVFELGMNRRGEILEIAEVLKPNIALITNIGNAHIEFFGTREEILKEKKCIFKYLTKTDTALIPKDDEYACTLAQGVNARVVFYGQDSFDELENTRSLGLDGTEITWAGEKINFSLPGKHSLEDALAAIAIAREVRVGGSAVKKGLESVKPLFGRLEILKGRTTVIRDCYNASPESTAKSIEFCDSVEYEGGKVYVIGDMLELGETSCNAHSELGKQLYASKADGLFLFGSEVKAAASFLESKRKPFFFTDDIDKLSAALDGYVKTGDMVLLKGSRGCALERLTGMLTEGNNVS
ncbi:MAG: UDP-N-acetylmuramoyl-tripeptide--D-alanyl-D-alanine ligase [Treponema sp.]|nr:UDP-N-acetylmuramoyl-tripeptide--D-alanyl-D-alanine ligase [Treponema sp.]MCL2272112.1 UDP-N-acetylmuramoyl-tripeptide--D-alanyl-D-alanine ligase [Treponema sp.]